MLQLKKIDLETRDSVSTIWLNQPETGNALDEQIIDEIIRTFRWLSKKSEIRVAILRGRGKTFCSGADLNWMLSSGEMKYSKNYQDSKKLESCFKEIYDSDKVVLNFIHGNVCGGGLGFIGAGDLTFATKETFLSLPEMQLSLVPAVITPYLLTRINIPTLKMLSFNGTKFSAEDALKSGLVDRIFNDIPEMEKESGILINNIMNTTLPAQVAFKKLLRKLNKPLINSESRKITTRTITELKMSDDARYRMKKFLTRKQKHN